MAKKGRIFVTTMYKWGRSDSHSYVLYAGPSKHKALMVGEREEDERGGKYSSEIVECAPNGKVVRHIKLRTMTNP